mmetsp:Transcript_18797/g.56033  ORF Transcript_18797/g.56033 Transcript_18797/m.56033 type:complete len:221 (+) Transcript_18797:296-958(+)
MPGSCTKLDASFIGCRTCPTASTFTTFTTTSVWTRWMQTTNWCSFTSCSFAANLTASSNIASSVCPGAASIGSSPRVSSSCRALCLPISCQRLLLDTRCGTTKARIGMSGRYFATSWAVSPVFVYTTIKEACTLSAQRTALLHMASKLVATVFLIGACVSTSSILSAIESPMPKPAIFVAIASMFMRPPIEPTLGMPLPPEGPRREPLRGGECPAAISSP